MADCLTGIGSFEAVTDNSLDMVNKYKELMKASLEEDSLYERNKATLFEYFKTLKINEKEKAQLATESMAQLMVSATNAAMQTALAWAKEERDGKYALAQIKAQTDVALAERGKIEEEICLTKSQTKLTCTQREVAIAASIRENGRVSTYAVDDDCKPTAMQNEGLKYAQELQTKAIEYKTLADTFREAGTVTISTTADGVKKGTSGDSKGYKFLQTRFVHRQVISFDDSKLNHAANAAAQLMGQLLASEIWPETNPPALTHFNTAMGELVTSTTDDYTP